MPRKPALIALAYSWQELMIDNLSSGLTNKLTFRIEKRANVTRKDQLLATGIAILAAFIICAVLIKLAGASITDAFSALYDGAFGSPQSILETLVRTTPLLLCAEAVTLAFRGKIWNIGAEGQFFTGAIVSYWAYTVFQNLPALPLFLIVVVAGFIGGALCGWLVGILKARLNVDVIISTVMMNYIVSYWVYFMVSSYGPWRDPSSFYPYTPVVSPAAQWLILVPQSRLHIGFLIALASAGAVYLILEKTVFGLKVKAMGINQVASKFRGINIPQTLTMVMLLSGGIAGLAGAGELFGVQYRLRPDLSPGYGFTGIIIAMLGGLNPLAVILASLLFGGLVTGSVSMQIITKVPVALIDVIQAIILLFLLVAQIVAKYRIKRVKPC